MPVITATTTLLKYDNVTVSISYNEILTSDDLNKVSNRIHKIYKSIKELVQKYMILVGKVTIDYGKIDLTDDSFDDMHEDALESELIKHAEVSLINKAFDKLHKANKEFTIHLGSEYYCERNVQNYFATKDFYENLAIRKRAMDSAGSGSYADCRMYGYEFDCSQPKFN
jgi:RecG-like helicase